MSIVILWQTTCPGVIAALITLMLVRWGFRECSVGMSSSLYTHLSYRGNRWFLYDRQGNVIEYEAAMIRFDVGLFFYLDLKGDKGNKQVVFFNDQLALEQRRQIYLLQLLHFKSP